MDCTQVSFFICHFRHTKLHQNKLTILVANLKKPILFICIWWFDIDRSISRQIYDALPKHTKWNVQLILSLATSLQIHSFKIWSYNETNNRVMITRCVNSNRHHQHSKSHRNSNADLYSLHTKNESGTKIYTQRKNMAHTEREFQNHGPKYKQKMKKWKHTVLFISVQATGIFSLASAL